MPEGPYTQCQSGPRRSTLVNGRQAAQADLMLTAWNVILSRRIIPHRLVESRQLCWGMLDLLNLLDLNLLNPFSLSGATAAVNLQQLLQQL